MRLKTSSLIISILFIAISLQAKAEEQTSNVRTAYVSVYGNDAIKDGAVCRIINKGRKEHGVRCSRGDKMATDLLILDSREINFVFLTEKEINDSKIKNRMRSLYRLPNLKIMVTLNEADPYIVETMTRQAILERERFYSLIEGRYQGESLLTKDYYTVEFMKNTSPVELHPSAKKVFEEFN